MNATHPKLEELSAFNRGRLDPAEQARVERHISECSTCCQVLRELPEDTLVERLRRGDTSRDGLAGATRGLPTDGSAVSDVPPKELADHPRYRIVRQLGFGGMGTVYQAEHRLMERPVALKVINPSIMSNPVAVERFRLEVKAAAKLAHPNIVAAHDAEQAGDLHFLVMEFVDGISLARLVEKKGPLSVLHACNYVRQAAQGLQHAFDKGMVHRDIKPQNLMITRKGQVKILDFGLARLAREREPVSVGGDPIANAATQLTAMGSLLGTPDYMAPEQVTDSSKADIRSDIYSLGCTLYYLLSGRVPFPEPSVFDKLNSHIERDPQPITELRRDLPPDLVRIVARMMAKDPSRRFQTPADVAKSLDPFAKTKTVASSTKDPTADFAAPLLQELIGEETQAADRRGDSTEAFEPAEPLSLIRQPRRKFGSGVLSRWLAPGPILAAAALVVGAFLVVHFANRPKTGDSASQSGRVAGVESSSPQQTSSDGQTAGGSKTRPQPPSAPAASSGNSGVAQVPTSSRETNRTSPPIGRTPRVLFVLATNNFYYPDYEPVRRVLQEGGAAVTVASARSPAKPQPGSGGSEVIPDKLLGEIRAADYDAVIFCGGWGVQEFMDDNLNGPFARQLIADMLAADKHVTALCMGTIILAKAGVLAGRPATGHRSIADKAKNDFGVTLTGEPVEISGRIITGRDDQVAEQFARGVLDAVRKK